MLTAKPLKQGMVQSGENFRISRHPFKPGPSEVPWRDPREWFDGSELAANHSLLQYQGIIEEASTSNMYRLAARDVCTCRRVAVPA